MPAAAAGLRPASRCLQLSAVLKPPGSLKKAHTSPANHVQSLHRSETDRKRQRWQALEVLQEVTSLGGRPAGRNPYSDAGAGAKCYGCVPAAGCSAPR